MLNFNFPTKEDVIKARRFAANPDKYLKRNDMSYNDYIKKFFKKPEKK